MVSVLFADLVGFTPFAEERDAEDVRDMLTRYFDLASDVITRYGGTVEKFIGDAVMAVWGAPTVHEDDAERAVRAGLELVDAVRRLGPTIQARAGVLTGEAAITLGATNQGLVAGDLVNTAARLQSAAPPGTVLVGEATYRAASKAIAFEEAGEQLLKGKAAPVAAWRALRLTAEVGGRNRSEGLEAPFVGRDDELRLLKDLFLATGREKRIRLVSVMGPAGIGKSRLAWEFLKYVDGLVEDTWWHSGRSPAYGEGITFWALGEMVRGRCGLVETDDQTITRAKVGTAVREWISDEAERDWVEPALLTLLGIETETKVGSEQLFAAWRTFFERIAARAPVVMVFEDLHFADSGTLDFIDHLLEWSKALPITVVTLARPELLEKRPDWGAGKRNFTSIYLEPLPGAAMRELLAGLIPGLPERAARSIVERADGIPLYAVETVRMLLADGRLEEDESGTFTPVGDLTALPVPQTLTALIAARLDGLDQAERTLVHDAAVLGQSFTMAGLAAVSGVAEADLEPRLRALVRDELLTQNVDLRSAERGQYVFVQALIREVAYNTLAKSDRKALHLAAARFFEQLGSDELAGALARHYLAAHANVPAGPEADALAAQARIALKAAADRAVALGAHDQAVAFLEQALTVTTDPAEQGELLERAGASAFIGGRVKSAEAFVRQAVEIHRHGGDRIAAARATSALGEALMFGGQSEAALALLAPAAVEFADLFPDPVVVALDGELAGAYGFGEDHRTSLEVVERVLEAAEHHDLIAVLAKALVTKGAALGGLGRLREGIGVIRAGEELARDSGLTGIQLRSLVARTYYELETDPAASLVGMHEGLALARRAGERRLVWRFMGNIGYTAFVAGDWDGGLAMLDTGLSEDLDQNYQATLLSNALIIRACRGESVAEGLAELERETTAETDPGLVASALDAQANAAFASGRLTDARAAWLRTAHLITSLAPACLYEAARPALWERDLEAVRADLAALDATGVHGRVVETRRTTLRAGLAALDGLPTDALVLYRDALRGWRDLRLPWDEALTAIDMVTLLDHSDPEVRAAGAAAREILLRLGATPFLDRLDAAVASATPIVGLPGRVDEPIDTSSDARLPAR